MIIMAVIMAALRDISVSTSLSENEGWMIYSCLVDMLTFVGGLIGVRYMGGSLSNG